MLVGGLTITYGRAPKRTTPIRAHGARLHCGTGFTSDPLPPALDGGGSTASGRAASIDFPLPRVTTNGPSPDYAT